MKEKVKIRRKKYLIIILLICLICGIVALSYIYWYLNTQYDLRFIDGTSSGATKADVQNQLQKEVDESINSFQIESNIVFDYVSKTSNFFVSNDNKEGYLMDLTLYSEDEKEILTVSKIESGKIILNQMPKKSIAAGNYKGKAKMVFYLNEDKVTEVNVEIKYKVIN